MECRLRISWVIGRRKMTHCQLCNAFVIQLRWSLHKKFRSSPSCKKPDVHNTEGHRSRNGSAVAYLGFRKRERYRDAEGAPRTHREWGLETTFTEKLAFYSWKRNILVHLNTAYGWLMIVVYSYNDNNNKSLKPSTAK